MGTWGTGLFDDDTACDYAEDVMAGSDAFGMLRSFLDKGIQFEYLEAPDGTEIIVAAALIDGLINKTKLNYGSGELDSWIQKNSHIDAGSLRSLAVTSLKGVLAENSELNELWLENEEEYPAWRKNIEDLIDRLK